jgi:hypothetical protein
MFRMTSRMIQGPLLVAMLLAQGPLARDPIDSVKSLAIRPVPQAPTTSPPASVWVPARRVVLPGGGVEQVLVPGHYERVISPTQVAVPPLVIHTPSGQTLTIPAGDRPPVDQRIGP